MATRSSFRFIVPLFVLSIIGLSILFVTQKAQKPEIFLSGEIHLSMELGESEAQNKTLFITLFDEKSKSPMPYAAFKTTVSRKPGKLLSFALTPQNIRIMNPEAERPTRFRVKARLDIMGTAGPDKEGDLIGEVFSVNKGQEGVLIVINRRV